MLKRVGIDVDGVAADLHAAWLNRLGKRIGRVLTPDDMTQWHFWHDFGVTAELVWSLFTPDIYDEVQPYPNTLEAIREIQAAGHTVAFVTSTQREEEFIRKRDWLYHHGLVMGTTEIHPVGPWARFTSKGDPLLRLDMLVDDSVENLDGFPGYPVLMTRPHNRRLITPHRRVKSLLEFAALITNDPGVEPGALDAILDSYNYAADHCALIASPQRSSCVIGGSPMCTITPDPLPLDLSTVHENVDESNVSALPSDASERKGVPLVTGLLDYFPAALAEVAKISVAGNKQHFVDEPLHWDRTKSSDHADAAGRHLVDRGKLDTDGKRHSAKLAWRALALLEEELEAAGAPPSRASTF